MGIRRTVSGSLRRVVGSDRVAQVGRLEARARSRLIDVLDVEGARPVRPKPGPAAKKAAAKKAAAKKTAAKKTAGKPRMTRQELIEAHGRQSPEGLSHGGKGILPFASSDPMASFPEPSATGHEVLAALHELVQPRAYLEVGVSTGKSLALSRTKTIAVDPAFGITAPINCDVRIFRETSDDFFALPGAFDHFAGQPVDLAFIDGMHLAEYALRDFMNAEKHMSPAGVIVLDDMIPRNSLEAYRIRRTTAWAGDVYKVHQVLATYRPDLTIIPVNAFATGSYLVVGLDPTSTVLDDHYAEIEAQIATPDPQVVPQEWLERRTAVDARSLLALDAWKRLVERRDSASPEELAEIWQELAALPPAAR